MTKQENSRAAGLSRREALHLGAGALFGATAALAGGGARTRLSAQGAPANVVPTPPPAPDPRYAMPPSWNRELRQLAPNVYAYMQGGGPGISAAGVSNAGMIVGPDFLVAIDALQGPLPATGFVLESATTLSAGAVWTAVTEAPTQDAGLFKLTLVRSGAATYYRLRQ